MLNKITLIVLVTLFSSVSIAAEKGLYQELDINNDGSVTKEEGSSLPVLIKKWKELDANADGQLDEAEFAKFEMMAQ